MIQFFSNMETRGGTRLPITRVLASISWLANTRHTYEKYFIVVEYMGPWYPGKTGTTGPGNPLGYLRNSENGNGQSPKSRAMANISSILSRKPFPH